MTHLTQKMYHLLARPFFLWWLVGGRFQCTAVNLVLAVGESRLAGFETGRLPHRIHLGHLTQRVQMTHVAHLTHHVVLMTRVGRVPT